MPCRLWGQCGVSMLCGRDAAERIVHWDYGAPGAIEKMLEEFSLLVAARRGEYVPPPSLAHAIGRLELDGEFDHVSASEVRRRIAAGEPGSTWCRPPCATGCGGYTAEITLVKSGAGLVHEVEGAASQPAQGRERASWEHRLSSPGTARNRSRSGADVVAVSVFRGCRISMRGFPQRWAILFRPRKLDAGSSVPDANPQVAYASHTLRNSLSAGESGSRRSAAADVRRLFFSVYWPAEPCT
jgi:hypothetical protein